jgi:acid ceramidase
MYKVVFTTLVLVAAVA